MDNYFDRHFHRVQPHHLRSIPWALDTRLANAGDACVVGACVVVTIILVAIGVLP